MQDISYTQKQQHVSSYLIYNEIFMWYWSFVMNFEEFDCKAGRKAALRNDKSPVILQKI
jgi:hypothetical protein